jgi:hypothetical protein
MNLQVGASFAQIRDTHPWRQFQPSKLHHKEGLGELPNILVGVAMITSTVMEALSRHETTAKKLWHHAIKGDAAVRLIAR